MSIDVTITNKNLFGKRIALSVILGNKLNFGSHDGVQLDVGRIHCNEIICYDPSHIARGFSVRFPANEPKKVVLRSLTPTGPHELRAFYDCVERIARAYRCSIEVDGEKKKLGEFLATYNSMLDFNLTVLRDFASKTDNTEFSPVTLPCAMYPIVFGEEECAQFGSAQSLDQFEQYLHEKQDIDVYYANPRFYRCDGKTIGAYALTEGVLSIFPLAPTVPFGITDPETGKQLETDSWNLSIFSTTLDSPLSSMPYGEFIAKLPSHKTSRFDGSNILIEGLSLDELRSISNH